MIANKMESNGTLGEVLVSESTKNLLWKNYYIYYDFVDEKEIVIPSINQTIKAYFVKEYQIT